MIERAASLNATGGRRTSVARACAAARGGPIVRGMSDGRKSWHRDGMPLWGWFALFFARLLSLLMTFLPLLLLAAGIWWWNHGGAERAPRFVQKAVQVAQGWVDAVIGK